MSNTINPLNKPGQLFYLELLFPSARAYTSKDGPRYKVTFDVDQLTCQMFLEGQTNIRLMGKMAVIGDDETGVAEVMAPAPEKTQEGAKAGKSERTPEQVTNGKAWSLLLHKRGFARCPGVWEIVSNHEGTDDHTKMRGYFGVGHLSDVSKGRALAAFIHPTAQTMIDKAWRDAEDQA